MALQRALLWGWDLHWSLSLLDVREGRSPGYVSKHSEEQSGGLSFQEATEGATELDWPGVFLPPCLKGSSTSTSPGCVIGFTAGRFMLPPWIREPSIHDTPLPNLVHAV